jgi:hypothetical protein
MYVIVLLSLPSLFQIVFGEPILIFLNFFQFQISKLPKMIPFRRSQFPANDQHRKLSLVLYLLFLQTQALHCHRKHDHSSDVLLRSDVSNFGGQRGAPLSADGSNETLGAAAKLVQIDDGDPDILTDDVSSNSNVTKNYVAGVNVTRCDK